MTDPSLDESHKDPFLGQLWTSCQTFFVLFLS
jgi:hypothetical protein